MIIVYVSVRVHIQLKTETLAWQMLFLLIHSRNSQLEKSNSSTQTRLPVTIKETASFFFFCLVGVE